eukprot:GHVL01018357.1.p2 GENE.GHVL01018357.1~~GHVL01018357.1.p2  ORF type:complete len:169 (-),score=23.07 GHVL01018357.1:923-1429(-)
MYIFLFFLVNLTGFKTLVNTEGTCTGSHVLEHADSGAISLDSAAFICRNDPRCSFFTLDFAISGFIPGRIGGSHYVQFCSGEAKKKSKGGFGTFIKTINTIPPGDLKPKHMKIIRTEVGYNHSQGQQNIVGSDEQGSGRINAGESDSELEDPVGPINSSTGNVYRLNH